MSVWSGDALPMRMNMALRWHCDEWFVFIRTGSSPALLRIEKSWFLNHALTCPDQWDQHLGTDRIQDTLDEDSKLFGNIIFLTVLPLSSEVQIQDWDRVKSPQADILRSLPSHGWRLFQGSETLLTDLKGHKQILFYLGPTTLHNLQYLMESQINPLSLLAKTALCCVLY